jgi:hypothetical protein
MKEQAAQIRTTTTTKTHKDVRHRKPPQKGHEKNIFQSMAKHESNMRIDGCTRMNYELYFVCDVGFDEINGDKFAS